LPKFAGENNFDIYSSQQQRERWARGKSTLRLKIKEIRKQES
jgi:hypothetical protein